MAEQKQDIQIEQEQQQVNQQQQEPIKYEIDGITVIEGEKIDADKQIEITQEFLHGRPKSGKPWKKFSKKNSSHIRVNKGLCKTWEEKQKFREERQKLLETVNEIKERNDDICRAKAKQIKENKKRKELNDFKSGQFQLIKNTKKINNWSKKAKSTLSKLPSEIFEKLVKKEYGY